MIMRKIALILFVIVVMFVFPFTLMGVFAYEISVGIVSEYTFKLIVSDLKQPTSIAQPPDGSGRLFVTEQHGTIRIIKDGHTLPVPFLEVTDKLTAKGGEQGLLDIAFHPDYANNGLFFITYTDHDGKPTLVRYHVSADNPDRADSASAKVLLTIPHPFENHNGGQLAFGPDGYLYFGMGDGGSQGDSNDNGQNTQSLLASIMRLDVDHGDPYAIPPTNPYADGIKGRPELWAKGLRNPWRFSFDQHTGDLYIADVGADSWEEVDFQPAGSSGGVNYGWSKFEANQAFKSEDRTGLTFPVTAYDHLSGGCAIIGGYVYRGRKLAALDGTYLYGDFCRGTLWSLKHDAAGNWINQVFMASKLPITTFGQTSDGEILMADANGGLYQLSTK